MLLSLMICQRANFALGRGGVGFLRKTQASHARNVGTMAPRVESDRAVTNRSPRGPPRCSMGVVQYKNPQPHQSKRWIVGLPRLAAAKV